MTSLENSKQLKVSKIVIILSWLTALLAAIAAATGLFLQDEGTSFLFTTLRGQTAEIFGRGLYRYDTLFFGAGFKGQDAVVLFLGVPLLVISTVLYQRGSVRGHLLLTGMMGYFLYIYSSMAFGAAYNQLFLLYIILFAASFWTFLQVFTSVNRYLNTGQMPTRLPRRSLIIFMFAAGFVLLMVWGTQAIAATITDSPPARMDSYTTIVTYAWDLAIITPATFLCAILIIKGKPLGYAIALPLLTLIVLLAPQIILSTIWQKLAGVSFTMGETIGPVTGFLVLGAIAVWLLWTILKSLTTITPSSENS